MEQEPNIYGTLIPLLIWMLVPAIVASLLAKEKGRNVVAWTVMSLIPMVNHSATRLGNGQGRTITFLPLSKSAST
ncbi:MAG: hypothetical protein ACPW60_13180 [Methylohalobius sp. ZOD2]